MSRGDNGLVIFFITVIIMGVLAARLILLLLFGLLNWLGVAP